MAVVQHEPTTERRRTLLPAAVAAVCLLLVGGVVGFAWGSAAGDPSRQVTGVVEHVNDHAISLTDVDGAEDGIIMAAFVANPDFEVHDGDTVSGTFVEFNEQDRTNAFIVEKLVSRSTP
ncbi:hypothetical protein GCM10009795_026470 [Nocardioides hankookensis]|uniref:DUF5666 domain-containing protein n=1 Tax=Nocardioides hankookensis TaxID=443157 RepID=A0ABW1LDC0_9ACTN